MYLLKIAISSLLHLGKLPGLFGSLGDTVRGQSSNDTIAILIAFLYELDPTRGLF